jgi:Holliday junction DNA helicase RuvA
LILELKEKVVKKMMAENIPSGDVTSKATDILREDVLSALVNLGYKSNTAKDAVDKVMQETGEIPAMDQLLKKTLKILGG